MPIKIPDHLPARAILEQERIPVMDESTAIRQDIRPLRMLLFNLMPDKITTETQIARVLGGSPLQIELTLLRTASYTGKNTSADHLLSFYKTFDDIKQDYFDGLIITGAPVEQMAFEDVDYWSELTEILDWSERYCYSKFFICWAAQAALYHFHNINKHIVDKKYFGIYAHKRQTFTHALTKGFDDFVRLPVSRYTEIDEQAVIDNKNLTLHLRCNETGAALISCDQMRQIFMLNHLEYDRETLKDEYDRDHERGMDTAIPANYFPDDNPSQTPEMNWRAHRNLLFMNWVNMVYQGTPYDLTTLGT